MGSSKPPSKPNGETESLLGRRPEIRDTSKSRYKTVLYITSASITLFLAILSYFTILPLLRHKHSAPIEQRDSHSPFGKINPSEKLEWHTCWDTAKCARLTVPMDYNRPLNASKDDPKVHIALILIPGQHRPEKYSTSPLLINPGGPGGSGVMLALGAGQMLQKIIGDDQDVIGFDPRGIGSTTPGTDCFSFPSGGTPHSSSDYDEEDSTTGFFHRLLWLQSERDSLVNSSSDSILKISSSARTVAKLCQEKSALSGNDSIFKHVGTPSVARDMISIIDAWDEWIDSSSNLSNENSITKENEHTTSELQRSPPDTKGKLVYWGFSYGTLLGATFAAMFPDRVGRVILDGVVDADHYVAPVWSNSIRDTDNIINSFSKYCHKAGAECELYRSGDKQSDVEDRFQQALQSLNSNPIPAFDPWSRSPVIITIEVIRKILFSMLYSPQQMFPYLATITNALYEENHTSLAPMFGLPSPAFVCNDTLGFFPNDATLSIMCSDKRYPLNETVPNLEVLFEKMANMSSFADVWLTYMMGCEGWGIESVDPPMRWDDHPAHKQKPIKTDFPVLFVSNTYDPVTPLVAGLRMAGKFVDAGLIEQESMGHCSLAAVSKCTIGKIRDYVRKGKVPPHPVKGKDLSDGKWDRCPADEWPFHPHVDDGIRTMGEEGVFEIERMNAMKDLQTEFNKIKQWGQPIPIADLRLPLL